MDPINYWVGDMNVGNKIKIINVFWAEYLAVADLKLKDREFYESFPSKQRAKHKHKMKQRKIFEILCCVISLLIIEMRGHNFAQEL